MSGRAASMIVFGRFIYYFSGGVAETYGVLEGTDTFLGGQINRGTVEGHTWMLLLFLLRYSINCHGDPILCVECEVSEGDIINCFRAIPVCQEVQHSFLE